MDNTILQCVHFGNLQRTRDIFERNSDVTKRRHRQNKTCAECKLCGQDLKNMHLNPDTSLTFAVHLLQLKVYCCKSNCITDNARNQKNIL